MQVDFSSTTTTQRLRLLRTVTAQLTAAFKEDKKQKSVLERVIKCRCMWSCLFFKKKQTKQKHFQQPPCSKMNPWNLKSTLNNFKSGECRNQMNNRSVWKMKLEITASSQNMLLFWLLFKSWTHLTEESHSEVGAEQSLARVHDLCHFTVCTMQRVIQVGQFLCKVNHDKKSH